MAQAIRRLGEGRGASPLTERCALAQHLEDGRLPLTNFSEAPSAAWILKLLPWQTLGFQQPPPLPEILQN